MAETWYVLENGVAADPSEVAPDGSGVLRHKSGIAVAMRGQVPSTRGVDPEQERAKSARKKPARSVAPDGSKDMKPDESKPGYTTRESRAES